MNADNEPGCSPGYMDIQINGAYNFDFSIYEGDSAAYRKTLIHVAEKIVESGVTACVRLCLHNYRITQSLVH